MSQSCVEQITFSVSILLSIIHGLGIIIAAGWAIFGIPAYRNGYRDGDFIVYYEETLFDLTFIIPIIVSFTVCLIFSIILSCGIGMKKPALVKIFFYFEIILGLGVMAGIACCFIFKRHNLFFMAVRVVLIVYFVILLLVEELVVKTYNKMIRNEN